MRVLVTGSSGLLGRPLCEAFRARGDVVDEFDLAPRPDRTRPSSFRSRDIRDPNSLGAAVAQVDGVVHLAAISRCAPAEADPAMAREINVGGTHNVLEALRAARRPSWFVFASSREVYGEAITLPVTEMFPVRPKAVYGQTKADGEAEVRRAAESTPRPSTILRFSNLYGSRWDYADRVIPAFVSRARRNDPLEVRGPGQVLDFLDVRDAVGAILRAADRSTASGGGVEVVNVASGQPFTLRELADRVVRLTGSHSTVREVAPVAWTPSKFVADISRARSVLGWEPSIPLDQGLADLSAEYAAAPAAG
ncbi:MAG: NAD(P)-dependent oxidoreductase [Thermoplasmata archaeon]|nr:NAD(P)-dependent oxidoreductase [Thermoplasmata archaeon]